MFISISHSLFSETSLSLFISKEVNVKLPSLKIGVLLDLGLKVWYSLVHVSERWQTVLVLDKKYSTSPGHQTIVSFLSCASWRSCHCHKPWQSSVWWEKLPSLDYTRKDPTQALISSTWITHSCISKALDLRKRNLFIYQVIPYVLFTPCNVISGL